VVDGPTRYPDTASVLRCCWGQLGADQAHCSLAVSAGSLPTMLLGNQRGRLRPPQLHARRTTSSISWILLSISCLPVNNAHTGRRASSLVKVVETAFENNG
jgi:hypothetical protein